MASSSSVTQRRAPHQPLPHRQRSSRHNASNRCENITKIAVAVLLLFGAAFFLLSPHRAEPPSPPSFPPSDSHLPPYEPIFMSPPPLNPPLPDAGGLMISPSLDQIPCLENGVIAISAFTAQKQEEVETLRKVMENHRKCADHAEIRHVALLSPTPAANLFSSILPLLVAKQLLAQQKCTWKWLIVLGKEVVCNPWFQNMFREPFFSRSTTMRIKMDLASSMIFSTQ